MVLNKKAFIGSILIGVAVLVLLVGGFLYYQVRNNGVQVSSGKFAIDIKFNESDSQEPETNQTNKNGTDSQITIEEIEDINYTIQGLSQSENFTE